MDWLKKVAPGIGIALVLVAGFYVECVAPAMRSASNCDTVLSFVQTTHNMDNPEAATPEQTGAFKAAIQELAGQANDDVQYGDAPLAAAILLKDIEAANSSLTADNVDRVSRDMDALVQACQQDRK